MSARDPAVETSRALDARRDLERVEQHLLECEDDAFLTFVALSDNPSIRRTRRRFDEAFSETAVAKRVLLETRRDFLDAVVDLRSARRAGEH